MGHSTFPLNNINIIIFLGQGRFRPVNKDEEDDPGPGSSCTENFGQLGGGRFIF